MTHSIQTYAVKCRSPTCDSGTLIDGVAHDQAMEVYAGHGCSDGLKQVVLEERIQTDYAPGKTLVETYGDSPKVTYCLEIVDLDVAMGKVWDVVCRNTSQDSTDEAIKRSPDLLDQERSRRQTFLLPDDSVGFFQHVQRLQEDKD